MTWLAKTTFCLFMIWQLLAIDADLKRIETVFECQSK